MGIKEKKWYLVKIISLYFVTGILLCYYRGFFSLSRMEYN